MESLQECPVNTGVPQGSIFVAKLFPLYLNDLDDVSVILLSMLMILLSARAVIRYLICSNN